MVGTSIPHEVDGKFGRGHVYMLPASEGTGVIAGGPVRAIMECAGIKDIRTKSHGTSNPINCVKATIAGPVSYTHLRQNDGFRPSGRRRDRTLRAVS